MKNLKFLSFLFIINYSVEAQECRWQMGVRYKMDIDFFADKNQYNGVQDLVIINRSTDTLYEVYYHLYLNAFQPGSDMDIRSLLINDPDPRVGNRISNLGNDEIGYIHPTDIKQGKKKLKFEIEGTILKLKLDKPIFPKDSVKINFEFEAQVPIQIRRTGRNNREGVDFSMAQWYPKLCNYDEQGWHSDPYIAREFYAPWGDFDVQINIDKNYIVAATGILQKESSKSTKGQKSWHFFAKNVHDFVWAADPDYFRQEIQLNDGRTLQFYHIPNAKFDSAWIQLPQVMKKALEYIEPKYGPYAYPTYSFIQGGDGGMEYPMATLISGNRPLNSLVGVCLHEWMHSWFQMMLATNESLYPWMDEGFTSYAESDVSNYIKSLNIIPGQKSVLDPMQLTKEGFIKFIMNNAEESLSTHADHYMSNTAYGVAAYSKGSLCLAELKYICGEEAFQRGMLDYYWKWRFKHPNPDDFFRVMEKASGLELDWFKEYWVYTTKTMDYSIDTVYEMNGKTKIKFLRKGLFPMPIDLKITSKKGDMNYTIPLDLMRGAKKSVNSQTLGCWHWVNPIYVLEIDQKINEITKIIIDPNNQMVDVKPENNIWLNPN